MSARSSFHVAGILRVAVVLTLFAGWCFAQAPAPVRVEGGLVQGTIEDGLTVYRGIPFAAPPAGDLRWREPQLAAEWEGTRQAVKFGPACMQARAPGGNSGPGMSEDCLYLNVWTPAKSTQERIPVFVWIYGGGFTAGATSEANYTGERLARKGVVLVSIAYRVGPLGFLAHPDLSSQDRNKVSGNYGLLDMISGLQWIQRNIAAFGGDPRQVTIQHLNAQAVEQDRQISEAMATYWTNFAKYGDPNGQGVPQWPAFSDANPAVMHFAQTPHAGTVPSAESLKVLDAYFAWRRTPEGAAAVK